MTKTRASQQNKNNSQAENPAEETLLAQGQAAFARMAPRMAALDDEALAAANINVAEAALAAIGVAARLAEPDILSRFEALPAPELDIAHVHDLADLAWATLHAARMADQARFLQSQSRLPGELLEEATATKARMKACCTYYLSDDSVAGPKLVHLSAGQGHRDLADDLLGYAALYEEHEAVLAADPKHYRASDREHAIHLGEQIYTVIGSSYTGLVRSAANQMIRAWTLLLRSYGEVSETGRWMFRHDAATAERLFPSLFALGRASRTRRREGEPALEPGAPATPDAPAGVPN